MIKLKNMVYAVQVHPNGSGRFLPLTQVIKLNVMHVLKGEWPAWVTVSLERDVGSAKQELERIRKDLKHKKEEFPNDGNEQNPN